MFRSYYANCECSNKIKVIEKRSVFSSPLLFNLLHINCLLFQRLDATRLEKISSERFRIHNMLVVHSIERDTFDRFLRDNIYHDTYFPRLLIFANRRPS